MGLESPRLDDRAFADLVDEARRRIPLYTPEWTDHNLSDPGMTLIELFAWMTDIVLYRLNRVPDKHYIKFMELIGMSLHESVPARVPATFWLTTPQPVTVIIPSDIEVATKRTETEPAIIFTTDGSMEVLVPKLSYLMTAYDGPDERVFNNQDVSKLEIGIEGLSVFESEPPATNDSMYLGFEKDLSNHILGIELDVDVAEGAGIDPNNPPYVWEILSTDVGKEWIPVDIDKDDTKGLNARGLIRLHLPSLQRSEHNEQMAYWVRCRLDLTDTESGYNFSPQIKQLLVSSWGGTINITNVTRYGQSVIGRSDGSPGQRFYLDHSPVVTRTTEEYLLVRMDGGREEQWQEVSDFSSSTAMDKHYVIDSNTGEVRLGPALPQRDGQVRRYGSIPPKGAMLIMNGYRTGGGQIGNVAANTINVLKTSIPYIDRITNRQPAIGGMDVESMESSKIRVPGFIRSLERAVTAADFEYLSHEAAPGRVGRVYCLQPPLTNKGEIRVLVIPHIPRLQGFIAPESLELPTDVRENIQSYLDERRLLSTHLDVTEPAYQWIETEVHINANPSYDFKKVQRDLESRLHTFINPLTGGADGKGWTFGRDLFVSDIMAILLTVPGVNFVRSVKMFPINYENRQFTRGAETQEIPVVAHGVVVSYQHNIHLD